MHISALLILMLFAHIIDDFYLQGILAKLKQRNWWINNFKEQAAEGTDEFRDLMRKYQYDYIPALISHAISWSTMILLPILFITNFNPHYTIYIAWAVNTAIHAITDHFKANKLKINLIQDQTIHLAQIFLLWILYILI